MIRNVRVLYIRGVSSEHCLQMVFLLLFYCFTHRIYGLDVHLMEILSASFTIRLWFFGRSGRSRTENEAKHLNERMCVWQKTWPIYSWTFTYQKQDCHDGTRRTPHFIAALASTSYSKLEQSDNVHYCRSCNIATSFQRCLDISNLVTFHRLTAVTSDDWHSIELSYDVAFIH